jgi:hypothetical protein
MLIDDSKNSSRWDEGSKGGANVARAGGLMGRPFGAVPIVVGRGARRGWGQKRTHQRAKKSLRDGGARGAGGCCWGRACLGTGRCLPGRGGVCKRILGGVGVERRAKGGGKRSEAFGQALERRHKAGGDIQRGDGEVWRGNIDEVLDERVGGCDGTRDLCDGGGGEVRVK